MEQPTISLITVARNAAATIERTLQSVAAQGYSRLEYIVFDGASTDGTQDIIERYKPIITHYRSQPDNGPYDATAQAYRMATGDIVGLLNADDWLSDDACTTLAAMHTQHPQAEMFTFGMEEQEELSGGALIPSRRFTDPPMERFTLEGGLYCQGVNRYYSGSLIREEGHFRTDRYPQLADREFYLRLGLREVRVAQTNKVLYYFRQHTGSNSTGGGAAKVADFLEETMLIAQDALAQHALTPSQRRELERWYAFNAVRAVAFCLHAGQWLRALATGVKSLARAPRGCAYRLLHPHLPAPYRHQPVSALS